METNRYRMRNCRGRRIDAETVVTTALLCLRLGK